MDYNKSIDEITKELKSDIGGLTNEEAEARLEKYGKNVLPSKKRDSILKLFLKELASPIEIILIITVVISLFIGEVVDALVIAFIILVDVIMGTYQENKALKSAEALTKMLKTKARVLRAGEEIEIDAEDLVIGDIILVDSGTKITSDARIIECSNLQVDESTLTGESMAEAKSNEVLVGKVPLGDRKNMLFAGTNVMTGRAKAIVVATAINTEIGKIASTVAETKEEKSPLTIRINKFTKQISIIIVIIAFISGLLLYIKGYEMNAIFLSVVALAVSAMPEGLSLALTMALTIASNRMSKKNVIVKKLNSVESLGSCTVIASDKTGTLTVNEQTARKIVLSNGSTYNVTGTGYKVNGKVEAEGEAKLEDAKTIIELGALNNEASFEEDKAGSHYFGDSIDIAFLILNEKMGLKSTLVKKETIPYESEKQYSAVFYEKDGCLRCTVKGSLEKVMSFSEKKELYNKQNEDLSKEGYRVIAICDGEVKGTTEKDIKNLEFLGMVAFIDPVREEAIDSIAECHRAGIKVVMITGDHPLTAFSIAKDLKLATIYDEVVTGVQIEAAYKKGEKYFDEFIKDKTVFSRVTPLDKLHIIESYKRMGEFVAVTGDGVNDAPAIKAANIGIAMGSGTDVAKDTASMIITDDNFKSIVAGVKEGRIAYANIRKITLFLLSCGMAEVIFYLLSVGFNYDLPLIAIQLLWINVVTDGLQDMALSFETASRDIMDEPPRSTKESLFNKDLMLEVAIFGLTIALMIFSVWKYLMDRNTELLLARSIVMTLMVFIQNIHVLNCRSEKNSIFTTSLLTNKFVIITIISSILLQFIVTEIPFLANLLNVTTLPIPTVLLIFAISLIIIIVVEIYKAIYRKIKGENLA
ncbi:MAG: HAD-IC family P-type ATPase [Bacilli bacterium]|nr:HAD-IC family P-type ATPase [Bacilli bacterium]